MPARGVTLVDGSPGPFAVGLGLSGLLYLLHMHFSRRSRSLGTAEKDPLLHRLVEPFLRLISPAAYRAINPQWLAGAAAAASADSPSSSSSSGSGEPSVAGPLPLEALPPPVRDAVAALRTLPPAFGHAARDALFCLDHSVAYLNHGSYGAALRLAVQAQRHFQDRLEAQPVAFMEEEALAAIRQAQLALAQLVHAEPRDLVFLPNATTAANAVLRSVQLGPGDLVLVASTTYPAVRSAAARAAGAAGAALLEVDLLEALADPEEVVARYAAALRAGGGRVKLALIDHIVSLAPAHLPVAALCALCAAHGAASLVDGAHAAGAVPLDIPSLGCTYYTSNLHKQDLWLCTPKGAAFLWAAREAQPGLLPAVTSHGYGLGFQGEFLWAGTADSTAIMSTPTAIAVMQALEPAASEYRRGLLRQAVQLLLRAWGTRGALGVQAPEAVMCAVELPAFSGRPPSAELAARLHAALRRRHRIEVPVACAGGRLWCRISAQVYNQLSDYERLAAVVKELAGAGDDLSPAHAD